MARGPKKTVEEKISEKEEFIASLQVRMKSEQKELDALYAEKRLKDLESISKLIETSGLNEEEAKEALESYARMKEQNAS